MVRLFHSINTLCFSEVSGVRGCEDVRCTHMRQIFEDIAIPHGWRQVHHVVFLELARRFCDALLRRLEI